MIGDVGPHCMHENNTATDFAFCLVLEAKAPWVVGTPQRNPLSESQIRPGEQPQGVVNLDAQTWEH
jgi:hypothetical protein